MSDSRITDGLPVLLGRLDHPGSVGRIGNDMAVLCADAAAEIRRLVDEVTRLRIEGTSDFVEAHASEVIRGLYAEVERLRTEGTPGVMHAVDEAFYRLTVAERNAERDSVNRLRRAVADTWRSGKVDTLNSFPHAVTLKAAIDANPINPPTPTPRDETPT